MIDSQRFQPNSFWIAKPPPYNTAARNATTLLMIVTAAKNWRKTELKRFSMNSGVVKTRADSRNGMNSQIRKEKLMILPHSAIATQIPYTKAAPIMPMKCSVLILEAMNDPPTTYHGRLRLARK